MRRATACAGGWVLLSAFVVTALLWPRPNANSRGGAISSLASLRGPLVKRDVYAGFGGGLSSIAIFESGWIECSFAPFEPPTTNLYDRDVEHLWNRLHAAFFLRRGPDRVVYGEDRLEPLLWAESKYLLEGDQAERAFAALDEFLREGGEKLMADPIKRAMLQRDLWHVASWGADKLEESKLKSLTTALSRLALTAEEIAALPDNYAAAVKSQQFPAAFAEEHPERAYLPPDLFAADGPWVCVGRTDGRTAPMHLQDANAFANSTFVVLVKLPAGRAATLDWVKNLTAQHQPLLLPGRRPNPDLPQLPRGTELALVRRAMLLDAKGEPRASPLTESVQLRVLRSDPPEKVASDADLPPSTADSLSAFELQLRRADLFAGDSGLGDTSAERDFKTGFASHMWDVFEQEVGEGAAPFTVRAKPFEHQRRSCFACHKTPTIYNSPSFQRNHPDPDEADEHWFPIAAATPRDVETRALEWKKSQSAHRALARVWPR